MPRIVQLFEKSVIATTCIYAFLSGCSKWGVALERAISDADVVTNVLKIIF